MEENQTTAPEQQTEQPGAIQQPTTPTPHNKDEKDNAAI